MNFLTCLGDSNSQRPAPEILGSGTRVDCIFISFYYGCLVSCCFQVLLSILKVSSVCHLRLLSFHIYAYFWIILDYAK